jgi:hypothetical protein
MKSSKNSSTLLVACVALASVVALLNASYYKSDLFPIGLAGLNNTGGFQTENCPYSNVGYPSSHWNWNEERKLIDSLGINCLGAEDAKPNYIMDLKPDSSNEGNYLHEICPNTPSGKDTIYLISVGYYAHEKWYRFPTSLDTMQAYLNYHCCEGVECDWHYHKLKSPPDCLTPDSCRDSLEDRYGNLAAKNERPSVFFRSPHRPKDGGNAGGIGSMLFPADGWYKHGTHYQNWKTFDGDDRWRWMADTAVGNFRAHFANPSNSDDAKYIWGYNLITEEPASYNAASMQGQGCWAAVDRIFTGHKDTLTGHIPSPFPDTFGGITPHAGIRGVENSLSTFSTGHRMIFDKASACIWNYYNTNVFQYLPDIDVLYSFPHGWVHANWN